MIDYTGVPFLATAVSVNPLLQSTPNVIAESVVGAVRAPSDIPQALLVDINNGFNGAVERYYNYGRTQHSNGVPSGFFAYNIPDGAPAIILSVINQYISSLNPYATLADLIYSYNMAPANAYYAGWQYLKEHADWTPDAGFTTVPFGDYQTGGNMVLPLTAVYAPTGVVYAINVADDIVDYTVTVTCVSTVDPSDVRVLLVPTLYSKYDYTISVIYRLGVSLAGIPKLYFWQYNPDTHVYPELDFVGDLVNTERYYPIIHIREGKDFYVDTPAYADIHSENKILAKQLNLDLDDIVDKIKTTLAPADLAGIDDMFIGFTMDVGANTAITNKYMFEYFKALYYANPTVQQSDWIALQNQGLTDMDLALREYARNQLYISSTNFNKKIQFNFITMEIKTGLATDVQPAYDPMVLKPTLPVGADPTTPGNEAVIMDLITGTDTGYVVSGTPPDSQGNPDTRVYTYYNNHILRYWKQITPSTYIELTVHGLGTSTVVQRRSNIVYDSMGTSGGTKVYLPIALEVVATFSGNHESDVFYEALSLVAYSVQVLHMSDLVAAITFIGNVLIFISIIYGLESLAVAIEQGVAAVITKIATAYITALIIQELATIIIDIIGVDSAEIIAAILTIAATYQAIQGDTTSESAELLMQLASASTNAISQQIEEDLLEIKIQADELEDELQQFNDEAEAARKLLDSGISLDLYTTSYDMSYTGFNETVDEYFARTIHITNPGILSLESTATYVNRMLTLPKLT